MNVMMLMLMLMMRRPYGVVDDVDAVGSDHLRDRDWTTVPIPESG